MPVLVVALGLALAVALVAELALAVALAVAVADTDAVGVANVLWWWCLQNEELAMLSDPPLTAAIAPIATPAATGMAIAVAMRARRLL
ncbi:MAG TPA: hypothetical protein VMI73_26485 [Trebonia sp.]|nr:hypothetical protein [Trebonia sp.]